MRETVPIKSMFEMSDEDAMAITKRVVELVDKHNTVLGLVKELSAEYGEEAVLAVLMVQRAIDQNNRMIQYEKEAAVFTVDTGEGVDKKMHIVKMLGISDDDAVVVIKDVVDSFSNNRKMSEAVAMLAEKYGDAPVLAGMMMSKTLERNDRRHQYGKSFEEFVEAAAVFAVAFGMSVDESTKICGEVGDLIINNSDWSAAFSSVGQMFGERAVYAGAFLLYQYTRAEGNLQKRYDFGRG